ncbi:hypothetical protein P153DRAFT_363513 [Dothidotthia symphoricarpi CBS 119687]|uniref:DUF4078 domain-containing protein n=1 Tax=Dothidotthia symphoricarpi CBS 119687 TaxID=1392245 RepID=A0A6A6ANE8_9PLEO|nr:uncharacterized protein P153DRAFT_363513 [Dothidotthia symphoricarpi CBS 119687]KAF2133310.1 hypothetical protein P153DRAFT_363513 [Dothidotthia symphoricarpi CBS 119687]
MSAKDAHLYGQKPKSRTKAKDISSSSTLSFSSTLSSLIKSSSTETNKPTAGRARPQKEDIFKTHNKNVKKRALKDEEESDFTQKHRGRTTDEKGEDEQAWKRTKRRMEEKARLYDALKRGDVEDRADKYGVDFDRKWAEQQASGQKSDSDSESEASEEEELVEYVDEFGRTRKGTRAAAALASRSQHVEDPDRFTARPVMPDQIIYGDTVQTNAFNPDATITEQMAELAAKRDKSLTPPPDTHFDGRAEARQRGTGFFHFSKDEEERKEQIARLEKEREETDKVRRERKDMVERRREMVREKKGRLREKRSKGQAERFLDELGVELGMGVEGDDVNEDINAEEAIKETVNEEKKEAEHIEKNPGPAEKEV